MITGRCLLLFVVIRRIGGLETKRGAVDCVIEVIRRIGGLEIGWRYV